MDRRTRSHNLGCVAVGPEDNRLIAAKWAQNGLITLDKATLSSSLLGTGQLDAAAEDLHGLLDLVERRHGRR